MNTQYPINKKAAEEFVITWAYRAREYLDDTREVYYPLGDHHKRNPQFRNSITLADAIRTFHPVYTAIWSYNSKISNPKKLSEYVEYFLKLMDKYKITVKTVSKYMQYKSLYDISNDLKRIKLAKRSRDH